MIKALQYIMELSEDALDISEDDLMLPLSVPGKNIVRMLAQISTLAEVMMDNLESQQLPDGMNLKSLSEEVNKTVVIDLFEKMNRNASGAAKKAGISPTTVFKYVKQEYGKKPQELKDEIYEDALNQTHGNRTHAAKIAGVTVRAIRGYVKRKAVKLC